MTKAFFITGTDTEVGKTWVGCHLLHAFNRLQYQTIGIKPISAGDCVLTSDGQRINQDALQLQQASSVSASCASINPVCLNTACSPHIAAEIDAVNIDIDRLAEHIKQTTRTADIAFIEGAGGWFAPISANNTIACLAHALAMPIILVVGLRLGCLNHALLTASAIQQAGFPKLVAWLGNAIDRDFNFSAENIATLNARLGIPCLGIVPYNAQPTDKQASIFSPQTLLHTLLGNHTT